MVESTVMHAHLSGHEYYWDCLLHNEYCMHPDDYCFELTTQCVSTLKNLPTLCVKEMEILYYA